MKIAELTAFVVRIPLRKAIKHASHTRSETENIVVRCTLDDGTVGYGEGAPREYVTGETANTAIELLKRSDLRSQLEPCADFGKVIALAERLRLAPVPGGHRGVRGDAARRGAGLA